MKLNARKDPGLVHPVTKETLTIDIWLPSLRLGFEYQVMLHALSMYEEY